MAQLKQVLQAIKNIDFNTLDEILDDDMSYMEVSKSLFLDTLKKKIQAQIDDNFIGFDRIVENNGSYMFYKTGYPYLNLYFKLNNEEILDIFLSQDDAGIPEEIYYGEIYFSFYEEDKVNFEPDLKYNLVKYKADKAVLDFKTLLKEPCINIEELDNWRIKYEEIVSLLGLNSPFDSKVYKAFLEVDEICLIVYNLTTFIDNYKYAKGALREYRNLDTHIEKELVYWLFTHKKNKLHFYDEWLTDWQTTGIIKINRGFEMLVDCSSYLDAFQYAHIYEKLESELIEKYVPTMEHYEKHKNGIEMSLESHLKIHNKYLDILPE